MSSPRSSPRRRGEARPTALYPAIGPYRPDTAAYRTWTVFDLKPRVKELGWQGFSDTSRDELIELLEQSQTSHGPLGHGEVRETGTTIGAGEVAPEEIGESG